MLPGSGQESRPVIRPIHQVQVFACLVPTDMRRSFDGLSGMVRQMLLQDSAEWRAVSGSQSLATTKNPRLFRCIRS